MPILKRVPDFEEGKTFIIENVKVKYASVFQPNTNYRPEWCVVIIVPLEMQQQFYEVGFRLKVDSDNDVTLRARRWVRLDDGTEMKPPQVVDADGNPWDPNVRGLIGNGSRCNVKVKAKYTTYQGVEGLSCYLEGLQVCDLIPYTASGPAFGKAEGNTAGFSQSGFVPQHGQQPAPGSFTPPGYTPPPPANPGGFVPPGYQPPPAQQQQQGFVPPGYQQQPGFVPPGYAPPPAQPGYGGQQQQPPGGYGPPGFPPPQQPYIQPPPAQQQHGFVPPGYQPPPAQQQQAERDFAPPGFTPGPYPTTGDDVPF